MLEVRDPADVRSVVGEVPAMTAADVAAAYSLARTAFATWRRTGPLDRAAVLSRCADLIRARAEDGAVILVRENGKTLAEARVEVAKTADFLDYYASFARQPWGELLADARPGTQTSTTGRAGRRGARDLPVERPLDHPRAEARACSHRGQHSAAQGRLADPDDRELAGRAVCRGQAARRRGAGDHGPQRRDLRRAARLAGRGYLHRVERGRQLPAPHPGRSERPAAGGARRQERLGGPRGRRPRHGGGHRRQRGLRAGGPALHGHQQADRRGVGGPGADRAAARPGRRDRGRPRTRPGDHHGAAQLRRAPRRRARAHRAGQEGRRRGHPRRRPTRFGRPFIRLLRGADADQRDACAIALARRGVRAGARDHHRRLASTTRSGWPTTPPSAWPQPCSPAA